MKNKQLIAILFLGILLAVFGCRSEKDVIMMNNSLTEQSPVSIILQHNSPIVTDELMQEVIPFQLDKPLRQGDTLIKGLGTPNTPIQIRDITFMGEVLASGVIEANGKFSFVVKPLQKGHRLGITLEQFDTTSSDYEYFRKKEFNGKYPMMVPQVGFFYDTAIVL